MNKIGITTTVPLEVLLAAGYQPIDLNNILVSSPNPTVYITIAEHAGFPLNCCAWIKGIYGVCLDTGLKDVLCVTSGDCSNTVMLMEVLKLKGVNAMPFAYPETPDIRQMQGTLKKLAQAFGTTLRAASRVQGELKPARELALKLDELTWKENKASGWENHLWLVSASDFNGDVEQYQQDLKSLIDSLDARRPHPENEIRLAYLGVPSVYAKELYPYVEKHGARVVYNEIQQQFAMPAGHRSERTADRPDRGASLAEQYSKYTYPYSLHERLKVSKAEIKKRRIDGVIHYVQAFCHRGIGDIVIRDAVHLPLLTLEGNADFYLNGHLKTRLEAFLDMIQQRKKASK